MASSDSANVAKYPTCAGQSQKYGAVAYGNSQQWHIDLSFLVGMKKSPATRISD
ncbi:MAG: hypothetical protein ACI91G_000647 [Gammaproteobacteria bacterium]|jgi:hypothetical protein